jgi:Flp pilus assembly pilin Flp
MRDDRGQTLVEYALIISLVALVAVAALTFLGSSLDAEFSDIGSHIP